MSRSSAPQRPPGLNDPSQDVLFDSGFPQQLSAGLITPSDLPRKRHTSNTSSLDYRDEFGIPLLPAHSRSTEHKQYFANSSRSSLANFQDYPWSKSPNTPTYGDTSYHEIGSKAPELPDPQNAYNPYSLDNDSSQRFSLYKPPTFPEAETNKRQRKHPFSQDYEPPDWKNLATHFMLCGLTYPFLLIFVIMARGQTLFTARLLIGLGCGIAGLLLGLSLLRLARGILEAATWATLIHQSRVSDNGGIRLRDLAAQSDDHKGAMSAVRLIWDRRSYAGARLENRRDYDSRRWTPFIFYFLFNIATAGLLSFLLARVVDIDVRLVHQRERFEEVAVMGTLSPQDLKAAAELQKSAFDNYLITWTLSPFSIHGGLPDVITFPYQGERVYFSEVALSQLLPNGTGFGTFDITTTAPKVELNQTVAPQTPTGDPLIGVDPGSLLMFPRWGITIKCAKIPNGDINIVTRSENNRSYVFTPRDTVRNIFEQMHHEFPPILNNPLNLTRTLEVNDTVPPNLDISSIALGAMFWDNGVAHSMKSTPISLGADSLGFVTMETLLVRLNTRFAPNGKFSKYSDPIPNGAGDNDSFIGFDAATCVELYKPYMLEVYNSSVGLPTTLLISNQTNSIVNAFRGPRLVGKPLNDPEVNRTLDSTDLTPAYITAHQNSVNQILKDNGRDFDYVPSPTLISYTKGSGPLGYTELDMDAYEQARALADASNVLPYFAGSGKLLARKFNDRIVTSVTIYPILVALLITSVFGLGLISALFVPKLPLDVPRRAFDLYSWMSAFYAHELVAERSSGIVKGMSLEEIQEKLGEVRFRYVG